MKLLNDNDVKFLLAIKHEDVTMSLIKSMIGRTVKHPEPRFSVTDYFMLPENACANNLPGYTTVGAYIFNRIIIDKRFKDTIGYVNVPISNKVLSTLYDLISDAEFDDKIQSEDFFEFIDGIEWLGGGDIGDMINVSFSTRLFTLSPALKQKREELLTKFANELANGDVITGTRVEDEIVAFAKKELSQLPEWDNYASGSKLNFENNYKNVFLMKGPIINNATGEWTVATSNYDTGIRKDEYAAFSDSAVGGTYNRAKGVAIGGYTVKKFIATLQDIMTADKDTDCGSREYLPTLIDKEFKKGLLYRYMIEGTKLVQLTPDNFDSYDGKTVKLRSPQYCHYDAPNICNKCCGDHPYKLNLKTIGLAATKIGSTLLNKRLKSFHNKKVSIYTLTIEDLLWQPPMVS